VNLPLCSVFIFFPSFPDVGHQVASEALHEVSNSFLPLITVNITFQEAAVDGCHCRGGGGKVVDKILNYGEVFPVPITPPDPAPKAGFQKQAFGDK